MRKSDSAERLNWMENNRCKHGHRYTEHRACYFREQENRLKIGYFDIESSGFKADWSIMLAYCILDDQTGEILTETVTKKDLDKDLDKRIVRKCVEDLQKFDKIVGFYSTKFDLPFIRTRAMIQDIEFPGYGAMLHKDVYYIIRNKFCLSRNRLENACRNLLGKTEKNHVNPTIWLKALRGDKQSLEYVTDHCKRDVRDLKRLYRKVIYLAMKSQRSI